MWPQQVLRGATGHRCGAKGRCSHLQILIGQRHRVYPGSASPASKRPTSSSLYCLERLQWRVLAIQLWWLRLELEVEGSNHPRVPCRGLTWAPPVRVYMIMHPRRLQTRRPNGPWCYSVMLHPGPLPGDPLIESLRRVMWASWANCHWRVLLVIDPLGHIPISSPWVRQGFTIGLKMDPRRGNHIAIDGESVANSWKRRSNLQGASIRSGDQARWTDVS
jgi:hypothetical protein